MACVSIVDGNPNVFLEVTNCSVYGGGRECAPQAGLKGGRWVPGVKALHGDRIGQVELSRLAFVVVTPWCCLHASCAVGAWVESDGAAELGLELVYDFSGELGPGNVHG